VRAFLEANRGQYQQLVDEVREACERVANTRTGTVRRVYGRDEKQEGDRLANVALKAPAKVARKWVEDFKGKGPISQVPDIAGLTTVVYYSDQITAFIDVVRSVLAKGRIDCTEPKIKKADGYFATHVVFSSRNASLHAGLKCELQVKTMLHEAWSSKTHDLTYKPSIRNDARLTRMMNTIADSIESIEAQSELVRELIHERWNAEQTWRAALRRHLFNSLPNWTEKDIFGPKGTEIRSLIDAGAHHLKSASDDDSSYQDIAYGIYELCNDSLREGFVLQAYLALVRESQKDRDNAIERALAWLEIAESEWRQGRAKAYEVWSIPLVLQACGDLPSAIGVGRKLLEQCTAFDEYDKCAIAFNLANHLVEDSYFTFPWRRQELVGPVQLQFEAVKKEILELAESAKPLRAIDETPFLDFDGMIAVLFATAPAAAQAGIELITRGNQNVPDNDRDAAQAFYDLHIRMAWRRLLDLETYAET
jgi:ppGpp synthetase/RelA/SpoT-type nucleotidyltranferase